MKGLVQAAAFGLALGAQTSDTFRHLVKGNDANRARNSLGRDDSRSHHSAHSQIPSNLPLVESSNPSSPSSKHSKKGLRQHHPSENVEHNIHRRNATNKTYATASLSVPDFLGRKCMCGEGRPVIFIVESNTGSTWLGQILEHHPCAHSFVPAGLRPDGHYRGSKYGDLVTHMHKMLQEARGKSFGVLLAWNYLDRYMEELSKSPSGPMYGPRGPKIVLYNREAVFQAISLLKKNKLVTDRKQGVISKKDCVNVNQRGGPSCRAAIGEKLKTPFEELDKTIQNIESHRVTARKLAKDAARRFKTSLRTGKNESNFLEFSYSELVCAQSRRGSGFLPERVAEFIGFGSTCATKPKETTSVKASPANPANSLSNFDEIKRKAHSSRRKWAEALERPIEAWPCHSSPSPNPVVSAPPHDEVNATQQSEQFLVSSEPPLPPPVEAPPALLEPMENASAVPASRNDTPSSANAN